MKKAIIIICIIVATLGAGVLLSIYGNKAPGQATAQNDTVSNDFTHVPAGGQLLGNMQKAGLEALSSEGTAMHIHQHLDIVIKGKTIPVPADIGVASGFISAIHTHDGSGILHIESPVKKDFTLNQFFKEWNMDFDDTHIGSYAADQNNKLIVAVNGSPINNVQNYVVKPHDEIEIWYGNKNDAPSLIKDYTFPSGL